MLTTKQLFMKTKDIKVYKKMADGRARVWHKGHSFIIDEELQLQRPNDKHPNGMTTELTLQNLEELVELKENDDLLEE